MFLCMVVRMIWKEKARSRIRAIQMDKLRRFAGYQGDGLSAESKDQGAVWSDERGG